MSKPLSERLEAEAKLRRCCGQVHIVKLLDEAAALARRVEGAEVVTLWSGDHDGVYEVRSPEEADAIQSGQRVALVPVEGGA